MTFILSVIVRQFNCSCNDVRHNRFTTQVQRCLRDISDDNSDFHLHPAVRHVVGLVLLHPDIALLIVVRSLCAHHLVLYDRFNKRWLRNRSLCGSTYSGTIVRFQETCAGVGLYLLRA